MGLLSPTRVRVLLTETLLRWLVSPGRLAWRLPVRSRCTINICGWWGGFLIQLIFWIVYKFNVRYPVIRQSECCDWKPQVTSGPVQIVMLRAAHLAELIILDFWPSLPRQREKDPDIVQRKGNIKCHRISFNWTITSCLTWLFIQEISKPTL